MIEEGEMETRGEKETDYVERTVVYTYTRIYIYIYIKEARQCIHARVCVCGGEEEA